MQIINYKHNIGFYHLSCWWLHKTSGVNCAVDRAISVDVDYNPAPLPFTLAHVTAHETKQNELIPIYFRLLSGMPGGCVICIVGLF